MLLNLVNDICTVPYFYLLFPFHMLLHLVFEFLDFRKQVQQVIAALVEEIGRLESHLLLSLTVLLILLQNAKGGVC